MEKREKKEEIFREDTTEAQELIEYSRAVLSASKKLHLSICGGMPGIRPRNDLIIENIELVREKLKELEEYCQGEEGTAEEEKNELTFF